MDSTSLAWPGKSMSYVIFQTMWQRLPERHSDITSGETGTICSKYVTILSEIRDILQNEKYTLPSK